MVFIGMDRITEEEDYTMADEYRMALEGLPRKAEMEGDADFLREGVRVMGQSLMELEVSQQIGAGRHERALVAVVQEAYVKGVSTRRVDELALIRRFVEPRCRFSAWPYAKSGLVGITHW